MLVSASTFKNLLKKGPDVLILGCESLTALGIMRCLGKAKLSMLGIAISQQSTISCYSKYCKVLLVKQLSGDILDILSSMFVSYKKGVIFCATDNAAIFVDKYSDILRTKWHLFGSRKFAMSHLMDKSTMLEIAEKAGFDIPESISLSYGAHPTVHEMKFAKYPCIVKPVDSLQVGKEAFKIVKNRQQLISAAENLLNKCSKIIIQEYIGDNSDGSILEVFAFQNKSYPKSVNICSIKKIRHYPYMIGSSSFIKTEKLKDVYDPVCRFIKLAQFYGPMDFELISYMNKIYFIEANFRCGTPIALSQKTGMNIPYLAYIDAIGSNLYFDHDVEFIDNIYWMRESEDWKHVREKRISIRRFIFDFLRTNEFLIFSRNDIVPFVSYLYNAINRIFMRLILCMKRNRRL